MWQANVYGKDLADQAEAYSRELDQAATAVINWQADQQEVRRSLEDRLQLNHETHYKELRDAQTNQARLCDQLLLLSSGVQSYSAPLPRAVAAGCQPPPAAWFMEQREPNLFHWLLYELSPSPGTVAKDGLLCLRARAKSRGLLAEDNSRALRGAFLHLIF